MKHIETALTFACHGDQMLGILALPEQPRLDAVLIAVGGPQYRVGSHRQFTLLARSLADAGYTSLRFDYRGMGDSSGAPRTFEEVTHDIAVAIDTLVASQPGLKSVVLWGLCDAASAALLYVGETGDPRVTGLCLLNPWVRSEATLARTHVKHYYTQRLLQISFWKKLLRGDVGASQSLAEFSAKLRQSGASDKDNSAASYQQRMAAAAQHFAGEILLILSGDDYTAKEFREHCAGSSAWKKVLKSENLSRIDIAEADHTFSSRVFRDAVNAACVSWLQERFAGSER